MQGKKQYLKELNAEAEANLTHSAYDSFVSETKFDEVTGSNDNSNSYGRFKMRVFNIALILNLPVNKTSKEINLKECNSCDFTVLFQMLYACVTLTDESLKKIANQKNSSQNTSSDLMTCLQSFNALSPEDQSEILNIVKQVNEGEDLSAVNFYSAEKSEIKTSDMIPVMPIVQQFFREGKKSNFNETNNLVQKKLLCKTGAGNKNPIIPSLSDSGVNLDGDSKHQQTHFIWDDEPSQEFPEVENMKIDLMETISDAISKLNPQRSKK